MFCKDQGIRHETSSPYNPMSNGLAEAAVKNCKMLLLKTTNDKSLRAALLEFRNTQRTDGYSPAQRFFGRRQRTTIPTLPSSRNPIDMEASTSAKQRQQGLHSGGSLLPDLQVGDKVRVQNPNTKLWDQTGTISGIIPNGRSFEIALEGDATIRRNRRFIKFLPRADI